MGKRRRKTGRCVKRNKNVHTEPEELVRAPHSFVIHRGLPGGNVVDLTRDFRKVMEPFTAASLKERKKNGIRDFVSIAGPLHVSHLCVFSNTEVGTYMKVARLPRGPTLTFKVASFCLSRDVVSALRKQNVVEEAFRHSPLIVMNGFAGERVQMKMMTTMFQNMFPTINLTQVDLNTVRRCVLLNYNPTTKSIEFRHYNIKLIPVGISKGIKKVVTGRVPNLSRCEDIDDFLTKSGNLSESEVEDDPNTHVTLHQKTVSRGNIEQGKSSVRLTELGPRLTLNLVKIEDGLMDGEVLYHDLITKSEEEKAEIAKRREAKKKLKEKRKRIQELNKRKKEQEKVDHKEKSLKGMRKETETDRLLKKTSREATAEANIPEDDDAEYFRQEVGEEPDKDVFRSGAKRPLKSILKRGPAKRAKLEAEPRIRGKAFRVNKRLAQQRNKAYTENRDHRPIGISSGRKL